MPCFASDCQMSDADLQLLAAVARRNRRALGRAVERFYPVVLALAYHRSKDFEVARQCVDPVVKSLFDSLLAGTLAPVDFAREAQQRLATCQQMGQLYPESPADSDASAGAESLHSLHGARKLVRRRAGARAIDQLPLAPLMAVVLRYHAAWTSEQMVGIVADTQAGVREMLVTAHRAVVDAMQVEV